MTDYIKREDAIEAFDPSQRRDWYTPWIVETLEGLPSADVVPMERYKSMENTCVKLLKSIADVAPVRHGYWQITDAYPHNVYCSECHTKYAQTHWGVWEDGSLPRRFCPTCGARMDGDEDEID